MPWYIYVTYQHKDTSLNVDFFTKWIQYVRGIYVHVKLVYTKNMRDFYYFYISESTFYPVYGLIANLNNYEKDCATEWYWLKGLNPESERVLDTACKKCVFERQHRISRFQSLLSASPFDQETMIMRVMSWMDVDYYNLMKQTETQPQSIKASNRHVIKTYCAALCGEMLNLPGYERFTPEDLVYATQVHLQAKMVPDPTKQHTQDLV